MGEYIGPTSWPGFDRIAHGIDAFCFHRLLMGCNLIGRLLNEPTQVMPNRDVHFLDMVDLCRWHADRQICELAKLAVGLFGQGNGGDDHGLRCCYGAQYVVAV
jgi:hypothetical protein